MAIRVSTPLLLIAGAILCQPAHAQITTSLISVWELEEASGQRNDSHGAEHLTDNNTVTSTTGKVGTAARFASASTEFLSRTSNANLQTGDSSFTFCFWVRFTTVGTNQIPLAKDDGTNNDYTFQLVGASNIMNFAVLSSAGARSVSANTKGALTTATWYFICGWHNSGTDTINISIDNGATDSAATDGFLAAAGSAAFRLGSRAVGASERYLNGDLDQVMFWKRVLTADERTTLYNGGSGLSYAALVGAGAARRTAAPLIFQ